MAVYQARTYVHTSVNVVICTHPSQLYVIKTLHGRKRTGLIPLTCIVHSSSQLKIAYAYI